MSNLTQALRVKRAANELLRAEADQMGITLEGRLDKLRVLEGDLMDFVHAQLHTLNDTLHGFLTADDKLREQLAQAVLVLNYYAQDSGQGSIHHKARELLIKMGLWE